MRIQIATLFSLLLIGCVSSQSHKPVRSPPVKTLKSNTSLSDLSLKKLNQVFSEYKGTPYRYGGRDRRGIDCSGFVNTAYRKAFGIVLPKTTEGLASRGRAISRDKLKVGDIVIFQTGVKQLHAGIYTGSNQFIHASTSKGVTRSSMKNDYWKRRYIRAKRYI
ncbi:C40 family peptidase [Endozoicomonas sp.]|uniref:C40 family peptidase n=1 Tax=Endozoicomonas sp. TaxID=1892382 RepID=UPI003AF523BB